MNNKLNKFLFLFILLILSIGAVSASNNLDDNLSIDDYSISDTDVAVFDNLEEIQSADVDNNIAASAEDSIDYEDGPSVSKKNSLGVSKVGAGNTWYVGTNITENGTGTEDDPFNNIKLAIGKSTSGDVIKINEGIYSGENNSGISINKGLTIESNGGTVIINGNDNQSSIFTLSSSGISLNGLTFANAIINGSKGAVYSSSGQISINDCTFENITANDGSPLYLTSSNINITDTSFIDNKGSSAGAVYLSNNNVRIENCNFINNEGVNGGAICCGGSQCNITGSSFTGNSARNGGAIVNKGNKNKISDCTFDGNSATNLGGTIFNNYTNLNLSGNSISNSMAGQGNSIYNNGTITNVSVVLANNATVTADPNSAVEVSAIATDDMGNIICGGNITVYQDGQFVGIVNATDDSKITVHPLHSGNSLISGNYSKGNITSKTGVIEFPQDSLGPYYVSPDGDDNNDGSPDHPLRTIEKAIYLASRDGATRSIFINEGTYYENSLKIPSNKGLNITGLGSVTIDGNQSQILNVIGSYTNISNINFVNGNSNSSGGAIYSSGSYTKINNCTFTNNTAVSGGAVYLSGSYSRINGTSFVNNTAANGGALYSTAYSTYVENNTFIDNGASESGGSIYNTASYLSLTNNTMVNSSAIDGKEIYNKGSLRKYNLTVLDNSTVTCPDGKSITVNITVTDDMGNNISGNSLSLLINRSTFVSDIPLKDGIASVTINPPAGESIVSATYPNSGTVKTAVIIAEGEPYNGPIYVSPDGSDDGDGSIDHPVKSIEAAVRLASSKDNDAKTVYIEPGSYSASEIKISSPINIIGLGDVTIDGNGKGIFNISAANANISNIKFTNASNTALYVSGANATVENCSFANISSNSSGGALYVSGANATVENCSFANISSNGSGGGLYVSGVNATVENCSFANISSNSIGGAVCISGVNASVNNCNFTNTSAAGSGGALYFDGNNSDIKNCSFTGTSSGNYGGAIYSTSQNTTIEDCNFTDATATGRGGAIYINRGNSTIENCNFNNNSVTNGSGGDVYIVGDNNALRNSNFTGSNSTGPAGSVYVSGNNVTLDNCDFTNTSSNGSAGALYFHGANGTIENCTFTNSSANGSGGAISLNGANSRITNSNFTNTSSNGSAGAVYITGSNGTIDNCNFANTSSNSSAGAITLNGLNSRITNSNFTNTLSNRSAGAVNVTGANATIDNCSIVNTSSNGSAGAVYISGANGTIKNSNITNSSTNGSGGAVYISGANTTVDNCNIANSNSTSLGGAVYSTGNNATISNSNFTNTHSDSHGGAVYTTGNMGTIDNCTFSNSSSGNNGGAIYSGNSNSTISNSNFTNTSAFAGGSIYVNNANTVVNNINSADSTSQQFGGSIAWYGSNGTLNNATINNASTGQMGGGVFWNSHNGTMNNTRIENSSATVAGGIYWLGKDGAIDNTQVSRNNAEFAAGVFWINGNGSVSKTNVTFNHANQSIGGITVNDSVVLNDNIIENNTPTDLVNISDEEFVHTIGDGYNNVSLTNGYHGYCINHHRSVPGQGNPMIVSNMSIVLNSLDHSDVSDYLKIMFYNYADNVTQSRIWQFTDENYLNSKDPIVQQVIQDYNNGLRVPDHGASKRVGSVIRTYDFEAFLAGIVSGQNLFGYKFTDEKIIWNLSVLKESLNKTVYVGNQTEFLITVKNTGNYLLEEVFILEEKYEGLVYDSFVDDSGKWSFDGVNKWTYDGTLDVDESVSLLVIFNSTIPGNFTNFAVAGANDTNNSTANNTTLVYEAKVNVEKITLTPDVPVGRQTSFIIRVTNVGNMALEDVNVTELSYEGLVYDHFSDSSNKWIYQGNGIWLYDGTLDVDESAEFTVFFNTTEPGNFTNIVCGGNNLTNETTNNTTKVHEAKLKVEKITLTPDVPVGRQTSFIIRVTNVGDWVLEDVYVEERSYDGLVYDHFVDDSGKWSFDEASMNWTYDGTLDIDESAEFTVFFNSTEPGDFINIVYAGNNLTNDTCNNTTKVHEAKLKVEKITLTPDVPVGRETSFIIRVTNTGDWVLEDVYVEERSYEGLVYDHFSDDSGKWKFNGRNNWTYDGTLDIDESAEFTVFFNSTEPGNFTNIVYAGNNLTNDTCNNTTKVHEAKLKVEKITLTPDVPVGRETSFIIRVTNVGDWVLEDVYVEERSYDGLVYDHFVDDSGKWSFDEASMNWTYDGTLDIDESAEFTVFFNSTEPGNFTNIVYAGSDLSNDTSNNTTEVHDVDLKVEKITLTPNVPVGRETSFIIRVTNTGDWVLGDIFVEERSYEGLVYDHFVDDSGKWSFDGENKWTYDGTLGVGESAEFIVYFKTLKEGNFTNIVVAGSDLTDNVTAENDTEVFENNTDDSDDNNDTDENDDIDVDKEDNNDKDISKDKVKDNAKHSSVNSSRINAGNPLFALLISLIALFIPLRYRKK